MFIHYKDQRIYDIWNINLIYCFCFDIKFKKSHFLILMNMHICEVFSIYELLVFVMSRTDIWYIFTIFKWITSKYTQPSLFSPLITKCWKVKTCRYVNVKLIKQLFQSFSTVHTYICHPQNMQAHPGTYDKFSFFAVVITQFVWMEDFLMSVIDFYLSYNMVTLIARFGLSQGYGSIFVPHMFSLELSAFFFIMKVIFVQVCFLHASDFASSAKL